MGFPSQGVHQQNRKYLCLRVIHLQHSRVLLAARVMSIICVYLVRLPLQEACLAWECLICPGCQWVPSGRPHVALVLIEECSVLQTGPLLTARAMCQPSRCQAHCPAVLSSTVPSIASRNHAAGHTCAHLKYSAARVLQQGNPAPCCTGIAGVLGAN